jgi:hypothetical protein
MRLLVRSRHFYIGIGLFTAFWVMASVVPNSVVLLITNSLVLAGSTAVAVAYVPVVWRAVRESRDASIQHIALGIGYAWTCSAMWRVWSLLWLTSGQDPVLVNNDLVAFFQAGVFLGACYHLTSPGAIGRDMPQLRWIALGVVVGTGVLLATLLALYNPDTSRFMHVIKPYIPR